MSEQNKTAIEKAQPVNEISKILSTGLDVEVAAFERGRDNLTTIQSDKGRDDSGKGAGEQIDDDGGMSKISDEEKAGEGKKEEKKEGNNLQSTKEEKEVKLEDFGKILGETSEIVKKNKEEAKAKSEEKKDEVKVETKVDDGKKEEKTVERDLTGFGEREAKWLRRMPLDAYEYFSKALRDGRLNQEQAKKQAEEYEAKVKALTEGKTELPASYFANPNAIKISPDYVALQEGVSLSAEIERHWQEQLDRIEKGENWFDLWQDPKTGKIYVQNEAKEPTASAKVQVGRYYNDAGIQTREVIGQLNSMVKEFKEKQTSYVQKIKDAEKQYMPVFEDKNSDEHKMSMKVGDELKKIGITDDNPAFSMLAKSVALNFILRDIILAAQTNTQRQQANATDAKKAGPTSAEFTGGGNNSKGKDISLDDFKKAGLPAFI